MRAACLALIALAACGSAPGSTAAPAVVSIDGPADAGAPAPEPTAAALDAGPSRPRLPEDKSAARVVTEPPESSGLADAAQVVAGLHPHFRRCFSAALKRDPNVGGRLVLRVKIDPTGKVTGVKMEDELGLDVDLAACLVNVVRAAPFPAPGPGGAVLKLPINVSGP